MRYQGGAKKPLIYRLNDGEGPKILLQIFWERGWIPHDERIHNKNEWNLWWRSSRWPVSSNCHLSPWQFVNHIPRGGSITCKDRLARNLRCMQRVYGPIYNFTPTAFVLPPEFLKFVAEYHKREKQDNFWICKPANQSRGQGIVIFSSINDLIYSCNVVVQKYIHDPFLISGYKFDLRLYVCVPSFRPLVIYVHRAGLVRFGTEKYSLSTLQNVFSHLTNTSINKFSPGFDDGKGRVGPGCKWRIQQLRHLFRQYRIRDWFLWQRIRSIIMLTLLCQVSDVPRTAPNCFELYGFDVLVDSNLRPWLLEVNRNPSLNLDSDVDVDVKKSVLNDLLDLLGLVQREGYPKVESRPVVKRPSTSSVHLSRSLQACITTTPLGKRDPRRLPNLRNTSKSRSVDLRSSADSSSAADSDSDTTSGAAAKPSSGARCKTGAANCPSMIQVDWNDPPTQAGDFVCVFPFNSKTKQAFTSSTNTRPIVMEVQALIRGMESVARAFEVSDEPLDDHEYNQALSRLLNDDILQIWLPLTN